MQESGIILVINEINKKYRNEIIRTLYFINVKLVVKFLIFRDQWAECKNMPNGRATPKGHPRSLLLCCFKDMCNHVDSPETQTMLNGTLLGKTSIQGVKNYDFFKKKIKNYDFY